MEQLAAQARMSPRTFARRFVQETGTTPMRWLTGQRILLAQQLLEDTEEPIDLIAEQAGFGNATTLRHHFRAWRGTTPQAYRRAFCTGPGSGPPSAWPPGDCLAGELPTCSLFAVDYPLADSLSSGRKTVGIAG